MKEGKHMGTVVLPTYIARACRPFAMSSRAKECGLSSSSCVYVASSLLN